MNNTKTNLENKTVTKVGKNENNEETRTVEAPLFIIFAEYLGYLSIFNEMAEKWCKGVVPETFIQKIITLEAKSILRQMKKDYSKNEITEFYDMYYPIILQEYDEKLTELNAMQNNDFQII